MTQKKPLSSRSQDEIPVESSISMACYFSCSGVVVELHRWILLALQQHPCAVHSQERLMQQHWWTAPVKSLWSQMLCPDYVVDGTGCHFECEPIS